jgi:hypothetical protein
LSHRSHVAGQAGGIALGEHKDQHKDRHANRDCDAASRSPARLLEQRMQQSKELSITEGNEGNKGESS